MRTQVPRLVLNSAISTLSHVQRSAFRHILPLLLQEIHSAALSSQDVLWKGHCTHQIQELRNLDVTYDFVSRCFSVLSALGACISIWKSTLDWKWGIYFPSLHYPFALQDSSFWDYLKSQFVLSTLRCRKYNSLTKEGSGKKGNRTWWWITQRFLE